MRCLSLILYIDFCFLSSHIHIGRLLFGGRDLRLSRASVAALIASQTGVGVEAEEDELL